MFDVVVVGSLNLDLVARSTRIPQAGETVAGSSYEEFPGGKGLNQAVAAARAGASVALVGAVGNDAAGAALRDVVRAEGIDDTWLVTVPDLPSGRAMIVVDDHAENSIVVVAGANERTRWPRRDPPDGRVLLAQLEIPSDTVAAAFAAGRRNGATTVLNPAPASTLPAEVLTTCDVITPNEHEVALLGGVEHLLRSGPHTVIVTRGAVGVDIVSSRGTVHVAATPVAAVDTTGAGDAFCGNLAAQLAAGSSMSEAVSWASAAGALATTVPGAVPSLPSRASVAALHGSTI